MSCYGVRTSLQTLLCGTRSIIFVLTTTKRQRHAAACGRSRLNLSSEGRSDQSWRQSRRDGLSPQFFFLLFSSSFRPRRHKRQQRFQWCGQTYVANKKNQEQGVGPASVSVTAVEMRCVSVKARKGVVAAVLVRSAASRCACMRWSCEDLFDSGG